MKRLILFILALLVAEGLLFAQKLSPNAEAYLLRPQTARMPATPDAEETKQERLNAIIEINSPEAIGKLEDMGVEVYVKTGRRLTASLPANKLKEVADVEEVDYVQMASPVVPCMKKVREDIGADRAQGLGNPDNVLGRGYLDKDIVVGIIDNGFEYGHLDFYSADGKELRVKRVWNQNSEYGRHPDAFDYGTEYRTETEILNARYDQTSSTHGSHVAGIATGGDIQSGLYGIAPEADIVLVSYKGDNVDIVNAVKYIFDYAESVGKPCVVNISLGTHYGPHDGNSMTDKMFDELCGPGRILVRAAGNDGDVKLHARKVFTDSDTQLKTMIGYPDNTQKAALLDIWGSVGSHFKVQGVVVDNLKGQIIARTEEVESDVTGSHQFFFEAEDVGVDGYMNRHEYMGECVNI